MARKRPLGKVPIIDGFERIKYQNLAHFGLAARVYSAYFGAPKRIIDVYNLLYCRGKQKPPSTGRISGATSQLVAMNYLDLYQVESSNWPLMASNLEPLYESFALKRSRIDDEDRKMLEAALIPTSEAAERFAITEEEANGKVDFVPSPIKLERYLNSSATLALLSLARQQQPDFKEERALLSRLKARTYGVADSQDEIAKEDISAPEAFAAELALKARAGLKGGDEPRFILLFKIIRLVHGQKEADRLEENVISLFE